MSFLKNHLADWAQIFTKARAEKMLSYETNRKIFDQLEQKLWFYEELNISFKKNIFSFPFKIDFSITECQDQVQIDFACRLSSNYALGTWKLLGNNFVFKCLYWAHSNAEASVIIVTVSLVMGSTLSHLHSKSLLCFASIKNAWHIVWKT